MEAPDSKEPEFSRPFLGNRHNKGADTKQCSDILYMNDNFNDGGGGENKQTSSADGRHGNGIGRTGDVNESASKHININTMSGDNKAKASGSSDAIDKVIIDSSHNGGGRKGSGGDGASQRRKSQSKPQKQNEVLHFELTELEILQLRPFIRILTLKVERNRQKWYVHYTVCIHMHACLFSSLLFRPVQAVDSLMLADVCVVDQSLNPPPPPPTHFCLYMP